MSVQQEEEDNNDKASEINLSLVFEPTNLSASQTGSLADLTAVESENEVAPEKLTETEKVEEVQEIPKPIPKHLPQSASLFMNRVSPVSELTFKEKLFKYFSDVKITIKFVMT